MSTPDTTVELKGTWDDPAIIRDPRIDHENAEVRAVAEKLHGNESMHMHEYISSVICPYCALRTSRVLRWAGEHEAGQEMRHDTPFGLVNTARAGSGPSREGRDAEDAV